MRRHVVLTLVVALAAVLSVRAEEATSSATRVRQDLQQRRVEFLLQRYEQVGITDAQRAQIRPLVEAQAAEMRAVRLNDTLSDDERQNRLQAVATTFRERIQALLTPEQRQRLQEIREQNRRTAQQSGTTRRMGRTVVDDDN
jgi:Spy/CpxP family protein refolding chaperone